MLLPLKSHYVGTKKQLIYIKPLYKYKVIDLTPFIIQDWIDEFDCTIRTISHANATRLKEAMLEQSLGSNKLAFLAEVSPATAKKAQRGGNIDVKIAQKIAKALRLDINYIFEIKTEMKPLA